MDPGRRARPQTRSAADEFYCLKSFKLLCPRSLSWPLSGYPPGWCQADHENCGLVVVCEWHRARAWLPVGNSTPRDSPEGYPAPLCPRPLDPGRRARPQTRSVADEFYCLKSFKLLCPRSLSWPLSGYPAADGAGLTVQVGYPCSPPDSSHRWHTMRSERAEVRLLASTGVCPGHALGSGAKHVPFSPPVNHVSPLTRRNAACPMPVRHL